LIIGVCRIEVLISDSRSLKEKRYVLNSLKAQISNKFNVSVAEVEDNDLWQKAVLGVAVVSNGTKHANQVISNVIKLIENDRRVQLLDYTLEMK